jgi:hypothetical protein
MPVRFPPGSIEAGDKTQCDRVTADTKDNRYCRGRCLCRQRYLVAADYDHRYAVAHEIGCERRQLINSVLRITILDRHVLALDKACFLQAPEKRNDVVLVVRISGLGAEPPYHRQWLILRPRHHRPRRCASQSGDYLTAVH